VNEVHAVLGVQAAPEADAVDRDAGGQQLLDEGVGGVAPGARELVVVAVVEEGLRIARIPSAVMSPVVSQAGIRSCHTQRVPAHDLAGGPGVATSASAAAPS
jgi:hypothetical protein